MNLLRHCLQSPLLLCGFRPFFLLTASSAIVFMGLWLLSLQGWIEAWPIAGGWLLWHAHELIFGFAAAATAGFALTAIPEFTNTKPLGQLPLMNLVGLWLAARLSYLLAFWVTPWPALFFNLIFWLGLLLYISPPVWRDPQRKHISFTLVVAGLAALQTGFFVFLSEPGSALKWLYMGIHALMVLIIVATSRVSMSVVNNRVEHKENTSDPDATPYLARPPRRYLAIAMIAICALAEFTLGAHPVTGWTALAAMAAIFNLLNDWHVGRPLLSRLALMLYASYWLMALGYGLLGAAYLGAPLLPSAGRHLLTVGAMTLSIFTIMCIVSRIHSGLWLDRRPWIPSAALLFITAALVRAYASFYSAATSFSQLLIAAGLLWVGGFLLYAVYLFKTLSTARTDGQAGCAEPIAESH
ncbi:NnrS family protein [Denitrificimonas caeni]|uniref:NnrS family protein n=1 Tax=Denitrificimonas caeni TaxID=521720 RepID=UPI001965C69D|nr:NnrS family protein [Denitrificimonas caeni]